MHLYSMGHYSTGHYSTGHYSTRTAMQILTALCHCCGQVCPPEPPRHCFVAAPWLQAPAPVECFPSGWLVGWCCSSLDPSLDHDPARQVATVLHLPGPNRLWACLRFHLNSLWACLHFHRKVELDGALLPEVFPVLVKDRGAEHGSDVSCPPAFLPQAGKQVRMHGLLLKCSPPLIGRQAGAALAPAAAGYANCPTNYLVQEESSPPQPS